MVVSMFNPLIFSAWTLAINVSFTRKVSFLKTEKFIVGQVAKNHTSPFGLLLPFYVEPWSLGFLKMLNAILSG